MVEQQSATPNYTMGYSEDFQQLLNLRSAETHARHLLPHLKQGLRVLDFGCGPGNISVGLARAVELGRKRGLSTSPAPPASGGWRRQEQRDIETLPSWDRSSRDPLEQLENLESTNIAVNRNDSGW